MVRKDEKMIKNSYSGYYKKYFLRSSYEYIFIKCLEQEKIEFKYEEQIFDLSDGSRYIPDFFFYKGNQLEYIVEIKSERPDEVLKANKRVFLMEKDFGIKVIIFQSKELKERCSNLNLDFYKLQKEWKEDKNTSQKQDWSGKKNPMYGLKQSDKCKEINRLKQIKKFETKESREKFSIKMKLVMSKIDMKKVQSHRILPRESRKCKNSFCNNHFMVIETSKQKFCSKECALKSDERKDGDRIRLEKKNLDREIIKDKVLKIAIENKDKIMQIKMNNIEEPLQELYGQLLQENGLKDIRNLVFFFTGNYSSRKALVKLLQEHIKSYHR